MRIMMTSASGRAEEKGSIVETFRSIWLTSELPVVMWNVNAGMRSCLQASASKSSVCHAQLPAAPDVLRQV